MVFGLGMLFVPVRNSWDEPECMGETKGRKHPPVSDSCLQKMREYYKPFNEVLFWMIGRDLGWNEEQSSANGAK